MYLSSSRKAGAFVAGALVCGAIIAASVAAQTAVPAGKDAAGSPVVAAVHAGRPSAADRAIDYRQAVMTVVGATFGPLGDVVKGTSPFDAGDVTKRAGRLAVLAPMAAEAFPDYSKDGQTKAKPEIWSNRADFDKDMKAFTDAAAALDAQVRRDPANSEAFKSAFGNVGQACKDCHDDFRKK